jgi:hypothetical protein
MTAGGLPADITTDDEVIANEHQFVHYLRYYSEQEAANIGCWGRAIS